MEREPGSQKKEAAADRFRHYIRRSNELHDEYVEDERLFRNYERFADWQFAYLLQYFADLHGTPGYREAIDFIISDLAGANISERDRDLERAAPVIMATLPSSLPIVRIPCCLNYSA